jgi:cytochrome c5
VRSRLPPCLALIAFGLCAVAAGCDDGAMARAAVASACPPPLNTVCPADAPSFAATVVPILDAACNGCHDAALPGAPWPLHDHGDVQAWSDLISADLLDCSMPPSKNDSGTTLSEVDRQQLLTWIACDSPNN